MPGIHTAGGDRNFLLFKETIDRVAEGEGKCMRHLGGKNEHAHVKIRLTPSDRGSGVSLLPIKATFFPAEYVPGVEQGLMSAMASGPAGRYEVTDLQAEVIDGSYHQVDSCIHAFAEATEEAVRKALEAAEPYLLEPWLKMSIEVPEEFVGALIGDLNSRRGRIVKTDKAETLGRTLIAAEVPEVELKSYAAKSFEAWTGLFLAGPKRLKISGVPAGYDRLPRSIADQMRYCASCERKVLPVVATTCPDCGHALGSGDDFTIV